MPTHRLPKGWLKGKPSTAASATTTNFHSVQTALLTQKFGISPDELHAFLVEGLPPHSKTQLSLFAGRDIIFVRHSGILGMGESFLAIRRYYFRSGLWFHTLLLSEGTTQKAKVWRRAIFLNWLGVLDHLGVAAIECEANLEIGGFLWARAGFEPRDLQEWSNIRTHVLHRWNQFAAVIQAHTQTAIFQRYSAVLATNNPRVLPVLASLPYPGSLQPNAFGMQDFPFNRAGSRSLGVSLLAGSHWWGRLSLNDPKSYSLYKQSLQ